MKLAILIFQIKYQIIIITISFLVQMYAYVVRAILTLLVHEENRTHFSKIQNIDFCLLNIYKVFLFISKSTFIQKETFVEQPNWQIYEQAILQTRGKREWNLVNTKKCTILSRVQSYLDHVIIWLCHHVIILLFSILVHMARLANIIRL